LTPILEIDSIMKRDKRGFYYHIDGAYGGYFSACIHSSNNDEFNRKYFSKFGKYLENITKDIKAIALADSIAIDPHKLGYVPYAAGSIFL
jgi:glutamate/tyrosine decarboxylase-like PLP-dependent enzyme